MLFNQKNSGLLRQSDVLYYIQYSQMVLKKNTKYDLSTSKGLKTFAERHDFYRQMFPLMLTRRFFLCGVESQIHVCDRVLHSSLSMHKSVILLSSSALGL